MGLGQNKHGDVIVLSPDAAVDGVIIPKQYEL